MHDAIEEELAALIGEPVRAVLREVDALRVQCGAHTLLVACPWRITDAERVLVGAGDLLTPADPDAELDDFDWDIPGASWLDVRLEELSSEFASGLVFVEQVTADRFGGVQLTMSRAWQLMLLPNSTPTGHVSTEFWRLLRPERDGANNDADGGDFAVGTFGVDPHA